MIASLRCPEVGLEFDLRCAEVRSRSLRVVQRLDRSVDSEVFAGRITMSTPRRVRMGVLNAYGTSRFEAFYASSDCSRVFILCVFFSWIFDS